MIHVYISSKLPYNWNYGKKIYACKETLTQKIKANPFCYSFAHMLIDSYKTIHKC